MFFISFFLIIITTSYIDCFNIETRRNNRIVFSLNKNDNKSYFGYGVTMQRGKNGIIVSAPYYSNQNGAVFRCSVNNMRCNVIIGTEKKNNAAIKVQSASQHIGVSLMATNGYILTCAPSWHHIEKNSYWYRGRCVLLDSNSKLTYVTPCLNKQTGNKKYGLCLSGLSSAIKTVNNNTFILVGSPGALRFQGILSVHLKSSRTSTKYIFSEITSPNDHSLIGYSISWGNYTHSKHGDVIGGAPRGHNMKGQVIIYTFDGKTLEEKLTIKNPDQQIGAYFGATICSIDLNGDGRDTLLVGAPMHSKYYDEGKVYVYDIAYSKFIVFNNVLQLSGRSVPGSNFGISITNIGDVDNDGYKDVAIGCVKHGKSENDVSGAVYIYNGGPNGLRKKYSQVIYAEYSGDKSGFGVSITGGVDIDNNAYSDIGVGEYQNGKAYIYKSRPVLTLSSRLKANISSIPPEVSKSNCIGPDQKRYYCFKLELILKQIGKQKIDIYTLNITIDFDRNSFKKRAYLIDLSTSSITSKLTETIIFNASSITQILSKIVYVSVAVDNDISLPVSIRTTYATNEDNDICHKTLCPILDVYGDKTSMLEIQYLRQCGEDRTCTPDLHISSVFRVPQYPKRQHIVLGSSSNVFHIETNVTNYGEPAYGTNLRINISTDIFVVRVEVDSRSYQYATYEKKNGFFQISVPLANPLLKNEILFVVVVLSLYKHNSLSHIYKFDVEAASTGLDTKIKNNKISFEVPVKFETCVSVQGSINPPLIIYSLNETISKSKYIAHLGPEVNFTLFVQNAGRLPVDSLITEINVPTHIDGYEFLYIYGMTADGMRCKENILNKKKFLEHTKDIQTKSDTVADVDDVISRHKRQITNIACTNGTCIIYEVYKCVLNQLKPRDVMKVNLVTRLLQNKMKLMRRRPNSISSTFHIKFNSKNRGIMEKKKECISDSVTHALLQESSGFIKKQQKRLRWWIVLISIVSAFIFLAIACAILYRVGFFKRKRIEDKPQRDELNETLTEL